MHREMQRLRRLWLLDGFNLLHAGWSGGDRRDWWRREPRARLIERVRRFDDERAETWLVFDGHDPDEEGERPRVVFAPSADEWLVRRVKGAEPGDEIVVVTGDRRLASRVRHHGAGVVAPRAFLARC